jgi:hypothetical protein
LKVSFPWLFLWLCNIMWAECWYSSLFMLFFSLYRKCNITYQKYLPLHFRWMHCFLIIPGLRALSL